MADVKAPRCSARDIGAGEHQQYARRGLRLGHVDLPDARMRMRREDIHPVAHAGQDDVVDIASRSGEEALVLDAPHRLPNSELRHVANPIWILDGFLGRTIWRPCAKGNRQDAAT